METGCARKDGNWEGDGLSTYLFDCFAAQYGGEVLSVDLDAAACAYARSIVGPRTRVHQEDSVAYLHRLSRQLRASGRPIDLLYLDAYDYDFGDPLPSAVHHLKELCAIAPALTPGSLVVVDDSFHKLCGVRNPLGGYTVFKDAGIEGKAQLVAAYFQQIGAPLKIDGYQCGWLIPE